MERTTKEDDVETITSEDDERRSQLEDVDDVDVDESGAEIEIGNGESG